MANRVRLAPVAALIATAMSLGACGHHPGGFGPSAHLGDRECMARAMYFESNRSSDDGMLAVGTVVMNRVQSSRYPKTVCGVVGQRNQFADGALTTTVSRRSQAWARAERAADAVLAGRRHAGVGAAMFFHTAGHTFPYRNMNYVTLAGGNVFYEKRRPGTFKPGYPWQPDTMVAEAKPEPKARATAVAALQPVRVTKPAVQVAKAPEKQRQIVLAMLPEPKPRPGPPPRSIADLIARDVQVR